MSRSPAGEIATSREAAGESRAATASTTAAVVAEILAEDLRGGTRHPSPSTRKTIAAGGPPVRGAARAKGTLTAKTTTLADDFINSCFPAHCIIKLTLSLFPIVADYLFLRGIDDDILAKEIVMNVSTVNSTRAMPILPGMEWSK